MPDSSPAESPRPGFPAAVCGWIVTTGLAAVMLWTTLCLGGWLADTMVYTAPAVLGLGAMGGMALLFGGRAMPALNWAALLPLPFLLFAAASAHWLAPAKWLAWREVWLWLQTWLVFFLVLHFVRAPAQRRVLAGTMVALGLAGVAMAAYQRFVDPLWMMLGRVQAEQFVDRSAGMFGIPNSLAGLLELMVPVCLTLLWSRQSSAGVRILCGWLAALFIFAVVLTGSRGGWLGLGASLALWPMLGDGNWRRKLLGAVVVLLALGAAVWALYQFSPPARARIQPFLEGRFEPSRPLIWKAGLKLWQASPWVGTGAGSYNVLFDRHRPRGFLNEPQWTHNDYLNTLSDYGLVGFILWIGAGGALAWLGWKAVRRARREPARGLLESWRWRLGLWLGLLAYAFHLGVDFHTKIPALGFAAALSTGLLLGDEPALQLANRWLRRMVGLGCAATALGLALMIVVPAYRAEALRYDARRRIDKLAAGEGNRDLVIPASLAKLQQAAELDPGNGYAWGDLAYATTLSWHVTKGNHARIGRRAEVFADKAIALCPQIPAFHLWRGAALDMQGRQHAGGDSFRKALALAPNNPECHYNLAYHLSVLPGRQLEAIAMLDTCLSLDPGNSQAVSLRERLTARR